MACYCDHGRLGTGAEGVDIHHVAESLRGTRIEFVKLRLQACLLQFRDNIIARLDYRVAARWPGTKTNQRLQIDACAFFVER